MATAIEFSGGGGVGEFFLFLGVVVGWVVVGCGSAFGLVAPFFC